MRSPYLWLAVSLGTIACGAVDEGTSSSSGTALGSTPAFDAGTGNAGGGAPVQASVPSAASSTGNTPSTVSGPSGGGNSEVCEVQTVGSGRVTPDMLIVLDRSGSMRNNGVNRWDPSVSALKSLTMSLGSSINFGLMTFPGMSSTPPPAPIAMPTQDCLALTDLFEQIACIATQSGGGGGGGGGNDVDTCVAGSIDVPIGANNGMAIATTLDRMMPQGATPTAVTLKAAHASVGSGLAAVDDVPKPKFVLLVTDGAPNCSSAQSTGGRGFDNQAVDQSVAEIAAMAKDGVKTYVIGYNTKSDQQLSAALDRMAQAGNTGDKQHHAIEDGNALLTEFQKIAGVVASCEFALNKAPADPSYVEVKIDGQQLTLNDANGWTISSDRRRISLQGGACAAISSKEQHLLSVRVLCERVVLQ